LPVPLVDLTAQYACIKEEIDGAVRRTIESGGFILGPEVTGFEQEVAEYLGVEWAVGVASGTDALRLALMACGIGPGDEVITTPFTFIATTETIVQCGGKPVFVDIDPRTYNIDVARIEPVITPRTKAVLPVHLYGQPVDMDGLLAVIRAHGLTIIEDCAQAMGAACAHKKVGTIGEAGCFSFFPSKVLGGYGDGGLVVTGSADIAERVRVLRNHGSKQRYYHLVDGFNSRLDALQAAVLRVKLGYLDGWLEKRRERAAWYAQALGDIGMVHLPYEARPGEHVYNYYTIALDGPKEVRDGLRKYLEGRGIASAVYYPLSLHLQDVYRHMGHSPGDFPESERAQERVLSLPMYPEMTQEQTDEVAGAVRRYLESKG